MAEFASRYRMKHGHQRRLINVPQPFGSGLRQNQPVVPIADSVLQSLNLTDELGTIRRLWREFGGIACALHDGAVLMQEVFVDWSNR
ncbi:MAG TPA: hypothetical protein VLQ90_03705, partial [Pyrinomonadaceae bacterium]|nr:hypothetical protein [Pyrinomonadaceae bacterium]